MVSSARPAVTTKSGTSTSYWWFDEAKAARLAERAEDIAEAGETEPDESPGLGLTLAALAGILLLGALVFRRAMGRPQT